MPPSLTNRSTTTMRVRTGTFWQPGVDGFDSAEAPAFCFLVSHGDRHFVFDLGVRVDWENYAPHIFELMKKMTVTLEIDKDIAGILDADTSGLNVRPKDIEAIILSHSHCDHIGDPSTFPASVDLVVGPGFKAKHLPGYPAKPDSGILESDVRGRNVREIDFQSDGHGLKIGRFNAFDFFGDGSFYLLDAPGHDIGNMCGLARVTSAPDTFVLMGGDCGHHAGTMRPSEYLPLPSGPAQSVGWESGATSPFLKLSELSFPQYDDAVETVQKMKELDALDNVFVVLAHDGSLWDRIVLYPKAINDWHSKDLKSATRWLFIEDFINDANRA